EGFSAAIARLEPGDFTDQVRELVNKLKLAYCHKISHPISEHKADSQLSAGNPLHQIAEFRTHNQGQPVNELDRLEKIIRQSMNPVAGTPGSNNG
ncbi:hypothetical protein, partial [Endozoicomonas sp. ONNA2]|uniref:hypothetical protein n=1 Tax=Endozoicomonas sp. ONNA2 TaxID=2828741 RepID=UPI002148D646